MPIQMVKRGLKNPMVNTKTGTYKAKDKRQKDKVGINDIGIF